MSRGSHAAPIAKDNNGYDKMKPYPRHLNDRLQLALIGLAFCFGTAQALAMPKAAEDENAAVSSGADMQKPRPAAVTAKPQVAAKASATAAGKTKPGKSGKSAQASPPHKSGKTAQSTRPTHAAQPAKHAAKGSKAAKPAKTTRSAAHGKTSRHKK